MRAKRFPSLCGVLALLACAAPAAAGDEPRFDVNVADAPARTFFEGLVDGTPYNIMLEPGVTGTLSLKLRNVSVPEVLDAVRDAYGYEYRKMATGFVIVPPALQTRIFQINYLDLERRGTSRTRVTSGQISQGGAPQPSMVQQGTGGGATTQQAGLSEPPGSVFGPTAMFSTTLRHPPLSLRKDDMTASVEEPTFSSKCRRHTAWSRSWCWSPAPPPDSS